MVRAGVLRMNRSIGAAAGVSLVVMASALCQEGPPGQTGRLLRAPDTSPLLAQVSPAAEPPTTPFGATTREMVRRLTRARELIAEESFAEGTRLLQTILDGDEDVFFHPDDQNKSLERSLKSVALELLGQLPSGGRESYETQHGPAARKMLEEALRDGDSAHLGLVARRYFHTQAGYEAAYRLAADHLDHSRPLAAALCLERLRQARNARLQFDPMLSLKAAVAWQRAGMSTHAEEILVEVKNASRRTSRLTIGGRDVDWFERPAGALAWLETLFGAADRTRQPGAEEWAMVGGNPSRNGESSGGSPYLNRSWRASTAEGVSSSAETDEHVARTLEEKRLSTGRNAEESIPALPSFQPLVVNNLVIVRSVGDIRAYDLTTGKLAWATGEKDQTLAESLRANPVVQAQLGGMTPFSMLVAQRAWNDAAYGTLSSDSEYVYAVEDLGIASSQMYMGIPRQQPNRDHNRLIALDARTGKAMWEVGGPKTQTPDDLAATFFLGPPLVLDQRLFCLAEAGGEVRLLMLDPRTGRLEWSQSLIDLSLPGVDYLRRQSGLTPAFDGGILVCPTGSGQVVAVDLTSRSLLWKYKLRDAAEGYDPRMQPFLVMQQQNVMQRAQGTGGNDPNRWLDTAVLISDARVIITPRDTGELHCLNLMDGTVVWKKPRGEGLFVAGIRHGRVIVVGRSYVQALRLENGEPAWPEPTAIPMPSGRGYGAGDTYYLPLTTAEVATLNLTDGRMIRSKAPGDHVPGNLVGVRGGIVSLGIDFVEAFHQLETLLSEIAGALKKNPDDVDALAMRGQMALQRGQFREAYADLKRALEIKSDDTQVRELMLGSLLEGLRVDFASYRDLRPDIERLIVDPSQRSNYLWLLAGGLQRSGDVVGAFETLLNFGDTQVADDDLDRLDGSMSIRRDRLVQSRVVDLYEAAGPAERAAFDKALEARVSSLLSADDQRQAARFLAYFGRFPAVAPLRERSVETAVHEGDWLAEELRLRGLAGSTDKTVAPQASLRLAGMYLSADKPDAALAMINLIRDRWRGESVVGGKTGDEVARDWLKKPTIEQLLSNREPWPQGLVEADRLPNVGGTTGTRAYAIPIVNDRGPFYRNVTLEVNTRGQEFTARDSLGRPLWKVSMESQSQYAPPIGNRAQVSGHLTVVSVGTQIVAIDPLGTADAPGARILWRQPLTEIASSAVLPIAAAGRRGRNPYSEFSGMMGPVTRDYVCFQRGRKLLVLDPISGRPLWTRDGMAPGAELLGDEEFIISISPEPEADTATVFRALDGKIVATRHVPTANSTFRREFVGRDLLIWGPSGDRQIVARFDVWANRTVWDRRFPLKSQYRMIDWEEAAILEPEGKFTVIGLSDGAVRLQASADPEPELFDIIVQRTAEQYLLVANTQIAPTALPRISRVSSHSEAVNGKVYGFERPTGRRLWMTPVERQGLDPHQSVELPALVMIAQTTEILPDTRSAQTRSHLLCIDRRNGRIIYDQPTAESTYSLETTADPDLKQIELKMSRSTVKLTFTNKPVPE